MSKKINRRDFIRDTACGALSLATFSFVEQAGATTELDFIDGEHIFVAKEAMYYEKLPEEHIKCKLCPRECVIGHRERGWCGVRENRKGTYYTLVHSNPCAVHVDPIDTGEFEGMLVQYNLLDRHNEEVIEYAKDKGLGVSIMGTVGGGRLIPLSEKLEGMSEGEQSTPELAVRFVLSNPGVSVALSGMNTMDMLEENAAAASRPEPLDEEEKQRIQDVMDETKRLEGLYCTGCNYCMPCPVGVDIPANFSAMNMLRVWGLEGRAKRRYRQLGARYEEGKPAPAWAEACVECGECEPKCPQDIPIIEKLKEVAEALSD